MLVSANLTFPGPNIGGQGGTSSLGCRAERRGRGKPPMRERAGGPPPSLARQNAGAYSVPDMQHRSKEASVPRIQRSVAVAFAALLMLVGSSAAETVEVTFLLVNDVDQ